MLERINTFFDKLELYIWEAWGRLLLAYCLCFGTDEFIFAECAKAFERIEFILNKHGFSIKDLDE